MPVSKRSPKRRKTLKYSKTTGNYVRKINTSIRMVGIEIKRRVFEGEKSKEVITKQEKIESTKVATYTMRPRVTFKTIRAW